MTSILRHYPNDVIAFGEVSAFIFTALLMMCFFLWRRFNLYTDGMPGNRIAIVKRLYEGCVAFFLFFGLSCIHAAHWRAWRLTGETERAESWASSGVPIMFGALMMLSVIWAVSPVIRAAFGKWWMVMACAVIFGVWALSAHVAHIYIDSHVNGL